MSVLAVLFSALIGLIFHGDVEKPATNIVWHWEDEFSKGERQKIENLLFNVTQAVEETLGVYPFDLHFHMYRRNGSREPVPWANTRRHSIQGVNFHVDPTYSLQTFLEDWTAPHEISHLSVPFVGRDNSWFAEGYASFMQYQIMERLGIYTEDQVIAKYKGKIDRVKNHYDRNQDFVTVAKELQRRNRYSDMYWGSATFFINLDKALKIHYDITLPDLVKEYLNCCRMEDESIEEIIASWDRILGSSSCRDLLMKYRTDPASELFGF